MDFTHTPEQNALRDAVRSALGRRYPDIAARQATTNSAWGIDLTTWQKLADLDALGLPFPEEDGGIGAGPVEIAIVAGELGRVLAPAPFVEITVLAGGLISQVGSPTQRKQLLGAITTGSLLPVFAHAEPSDNTGLTCSHTRATYSEESWTLSGIKEPVPYGAESTLLIVSATISDDKIGLFLVDPNQTGVETTGYTAYDGSRAARVSLNNAIASPLGTPGADQSTAIEAALASAQIAYCHEAIGAMDSALHLTTEYLNTRKQFGVTLSHFQSLTFRAADLYIAIELARSTTLWATLVLLDDPNRAIEAGARAKRQTGKAGRQVGQEAIQLHGGIGMTAEYAIGHYTRRLTVIDHLLGDHRHHLTSLSKLTRDHDLLSVL